MFSRLAITILTVVFASGETFADDRPQEYQGAIPQSAAVADPAAQTRNSVSQGISSNTARSAVLGTSFAISGQSCASFSSSLDLTGAESVAISILASNTNIRQTRVIPLFAVKGHPTSPLAGKSWRATVSITTRTRAAAWFQS